MAPVREWARQLVADLQQAQEEDRPTAAVFEGYRHLSGLSLSRLYGIAAEYGWRSGRAPRSDKGVSKRGITSEQVALVSALQQVTAREVKGVILPVEDALEIAETNGFIDPGQISVSGMQRLLRERNLHAAALDTPDPHTEMRSKHPNHVHVFDASICIQYYLKKGGLAIMDERDFYKNKPHNFAKIKEHIIRMVLADHTSHHLFVKYYLAAGENAKITYDFLVSAWRGGLHPKIPFRGVPFVLLRDAGAANIAKAIESFLRDGLDIQLPPNNVKNARRQGSAECGQEIVETHFEARLRLEPAHTLDELNAWALDWCAWWNGTKRHSRHGLTRTACWLRITPEQLRELPSDEILRDLYAEPEVERLVQGKYLVQFRGEDYRVKHLPGVIPNRTWVKVRLRPYHWPQIAVLWNEVEYLVEPIRKDDFGYDVTAPVIGEAYKAQPESPVQRAKRVNEELAYGEERKKGAVPFGGALRVMGHQAEKLPENVHLIPRRGTPLAVARPPAPKAVPVLELLKRVRDALGTIPPALNAELREAFGEAVDVTTADQVVAALAAGEPWRGLCSPPAAEQQAL